ncbi:hypothetical protein BJ684DRAFT_18883 [Piptocephalis cylindrospora]|uniref:Uncharacterized protein n=1 Tax=Piptocephalis cylindrospora TaxID=1907219 RepID=A0A4P9Y6L7_9FUNG|nr:hypothetical protein BJ684DRAFT_18883 [Piptocephalis cylindrospora]|eukprot:RKP14728.1 hypothetical protein BJ684DRAFT_18883 [Piptocephalis cylindrospora]
MRSISPLLLLANALFFWPLLVTSSSSGSEKAHGTAGRPLSITPPISPESTEKMDAYFPAEILSSLIHAITLRASIVEPFGRLVHLTSDPLSNWCMRSRPEHHHLLQARLSNPEPPLIPKHNVLHARLCNYLLDTSVSEDAEETYLLRNDLLYTRSKALIDQYSHPVPSSESPNPSFTSSSTDHTEIILRFAHVDLQIHFPFFFIEYQKRQWHLLAHALDHSISGSSHNPSLSASHADMIDLMDHPMWKSLGKDENWAQAMWSSWTKTPRDKYRGLEEFWGRLMKNFLRLLDLLAQTDPIMTSGVPSPSYRYFQAQVLVKEIKDSGLKRIRDFRKELAHLHFSKSLKDRNAWMVHYKRLDTYLQRLTVPLTLSVLAQFRLYLSGSPLTIKAISRKIKVLIHTHPNRYDSRMISSALRVLLPHTKEGKVDVLLMDTLLPSIHDITGKAMSAGEQISAHHSGENQVALSLVKNLLPLISPSTPYNVNLVALHTSVAPHLPSFLGVHLIFHLRALLDLRVMRRRVLRQSLIAFPEMEWLESALPQVMKFQQQWSARSFPGDYAAEHFMKILNDGVSFVTNTLARSSPKPCVHSEDERKHLLNIESILYKPLSLYTGSILRDLGFSIGVTPIFGGFGEQVTGYNYAYQSIVTKDKDNKLYFLCLGPSDHQKAILRKTDVPQKDCVYKMSLGPDGKTFEGINGRLLYFGTPEEDAKGGFKKIIRWETPNEDKTVRLPIDKANVFVASRFIYSVSLTPSNLKNEATGKPTTAQYYLKGISDSPSYTQGNGQNATQEAVMIPKGTWKDEPVDWFTVHWGNTNPVTGEKAKHLDIYPKGRGRGGMMPAVEPPSYDM